MKNTFINLRVSEDDKKEIEQESKNLGLTTSAYLIMLHKKNIKNN